VTDSNDPTTRRGRRPGREPPTIDLKATVMEDTKEVTEGKAADQPVDQPAGEPETAREEAGPEIVARESGAPPEAAGASETVGPTAPVSDSDMAGLKPDDTAAGEPPPAAGAERPSPPPPRHGPGYGGLIAAGLLGGVAGAALLAAFEAWRPNVLPADPRVTALEERIAGLPHPDAAQGLATRIGSIEAAQNALAQRVEGAQSLADQAAAQAKEALDRPAPPPETGAALTELGNRVKALEEASAATASLSDRVRALEESGGAVKDLGSRLDSLESQLRENGQAAVQAAQSTTTALQGLDRRAGVLDQRVSDLDQRLAALNRQIAEGGSEAIRAGTRVVLASRLNDALKSGAPFPEVLSALTRFNADPNRLEALEPMAEKGAPTAAVLAQSFEPLAAQILREEQGGANSWTDRLTRMAERVVTVRPVDQPESTGTPAHVARIRNALDRGAFEDAWAAWDKLPEPARRLSQDWGQQLKQRAAAESSAHAIAADAVAALNPSTR
jgi:hypothetical protein